MERVHTSIARHVKRLWLAYLILALSLIPTVGVYYRVKENVEARDRTRFERLAKEASATVEDRAPHYVDAMMGLRGLFAANPSVTAEQWTQYVASLEVPRLYPGMRALGFLKRVSAGEKESFLSLARASGEPVADIQPAGERPLYFPVEYLSYFETGMKGGIGRDHLADPERSAIIERAGDMGQPMATGRITLGSASGKISPGFAIYLPVYRSGAALNNAEERRAALQGFIFATFESERIFRTLLGSQLGLQADCKIFDGLQTTGEQMLFGGGVLASQPGQAGKLVQKVKLPMLNRLWTLQFTSLPEFEAESQRNLPVIALICWLTLSLLLFGLACAEVNARSRSEGITGELRRSEAALAAEKELLAVTLYSIGDGVITTDTEGCVQSFNKVAEQLTGWSQAEAWGKPLEKLFKIINQTTRELCPNPLQTALKTGAVSALEQPALLIARDGAERVVADTAAPIRDRDGGIVGAVVVFRDVTEKQKTEAELLKESKLESVGLLAGGIAHDFNNILQGIIGNISLARMNVNSGEKMLERLAALEKSALRAKDLTQQLVMFARGGAPIRKRMQVNNTLKDATLQALQGSNVQAEFSLPEDAWPIEVDEGQFRQVISNIVINAVQAMPGGGKIEVRLENLEAAEELFPSLGAGSHVRISIHDFGPGIRPEVLPRIFDPYFTTRKHARGLGLASAYSVVRKHDGQIRVDTHLGKGSTFEIYLPASIKPVELTHLEGDQKRFFGRGRVLVMDDEADLLVLVREMLELMGYEVELARDGAEALQRYAAATRGGRPFSAVIMDLTVPEGMGGKEAIRRLKELDPQVKAIVSSGYSYDPVMANYREFGFSGVIPKPYVMDELGRVLDEVIREKKT